MNERYIVGYEQAGKFVTLHKSDNIRLAITMANKYRATRKEEIKIKKKGLDR